MDQPTSFDKKYLSGFHYFTEKYYPSKTFSAQKKIWSELSTDERARYNAIARQSQYRGEDSSLFDEASHIDKFEKSSYNAFCSMMSKKTNLVQKDQWQDRTPEQVSELQALFVPDTQDISNMSVEQINSLVAYHIKEVWTPSQRKRFRSIIPSRTAASMASNNKLMGEEWRKLSAAEQAKYARISMLSKLKCIDDTLSSKKEPKAKSKESKSKTPSRFDDPGQPIPELVNKTPTPAIPELDPASDGE